MKTLLTLGKRVMNKLKGTILGFKHHMKLIEKEKTRQFKEIMRKKDLCWKSKSMNENQN